MTTGTMSVLDRTGDTKIYWDKNVPAEVAAARTMFDQMSGEKRYLAYRTAADGTKGERIRTFDPDAERIVLSPQLVGG